MIVSAPDFMPVIRSVLARGQRVRLTATGSSMLPFINDGDVVELEPLYSIPAIGELVLAHCAFSPKGERYVLHRVIRIEGEALFLRGDAQRDLEGPFTRGDVLGRVTVVKHNGRVRRVGRGAWRWAGLAFNRCTPLNVWLIQLTDRLSKIREKAPGA